MDSKHLLTTDGIHSLSRAWNARRDNFPTQNTQQMTDVIDVNIVETVSTSCIQFSVSGNLLSPPSPDLGQSHN